MSSVELRSVARVAEPAEFLLAECGVRPQAEPDTPCVTILLCTYNGARFLAAQLASIEQQSHQNWRLIVSDDGSADATLAIVQHFAQRTGKPVELRQGPRLGPAANFQTLAADPAITGDYFAFCDQDDVWHREKLTRALDWMRGAPSDVAAVYGARTRLVCAGGKPIGYSRHFRRPPQFANALVQSIAGANTMLFNGATKRLFEESGPLNVVSHDWWAYQLVSGSGGIVHYDPEPPLDYRQHEDNRIGSNRGLRAQSKRLRMVLNGGFARLERGQSRSAAQRPPPADRRGAPPARRLRTDAQGPLRLAPQGIREVADAAADLPGQCRALDRGSSQEDLKGDTGAWLIADVEPFRFSKSPHSSDIGQLMRAVQPARGIDLAAPECDRG